MSNPLEKNIRQIKYGGAVTTLTEEKAILHSIQKSRITRNWQLAEEGALFEKELAEFLGVKHAVLTTSGSCAGLLALQALELPKGSEVIIPATTFPTIFNIILQCGLVPVVVDSKIGTYNLDPDELEAAITENTQAIIVVHALGNPVDMRKVMDIAKRNELYVLEDNCDGWSTKLGDQYIGTFGDISFTSFHAAHIVSMGVGGGVFTDNDSLAKKVKMYRDWGRVSDTNEPHNVSDIPKDYNPRFVYEKIGYNFQPLELQAAMGRVQLKKTGSIKKLRQRNFKYLYEKLSKHSQLVLPKWYKDADICWFAFPLYVHWDRKSLLEHLENNGIETRPMFSGNILKHPAYRNIYARASGIKDADLILKGAFWISCHPSLTMEDLKYIVSVFDEYYA